MKLGFTGTREGMTEAQRREVAELLQTLNPSEVHHGDCVGADAEVDLAAVLFTSARRVIHPPESPTLRAWCLSEDMREPKPYLARNRDIVNETDSILAAPKGKQYRAAGTWFTIGYAKKQGKPVTIVYPDGSIETIEPEASEVKG